MVRQNLLGIISRVCSNANKCFRILNFHPRLDPFLTMFYLGLPPNFHLENTPSSVQSEHFYDLSWPRQMYQVICNSNCFCKES
jgi:hypothetical protein